MHKAATETISLFPVAAALWVQSSWCVKRWLPYVLFHFVDILKYFVNIGRNKCVNDENVIVSFMHAFCDKIAYIKQDENAFKELEWE